MKGSWVLVDVGKGTQDILVPVEGEKRENFVKAVLPSPTVKLAQKVKNWRKRELKICGYTMGGGPVKKAVLDFVKGGGKVVVCKRAARTFRDDLEEVKALGISVVDEVEKPDLFFTDLEFSLFETLRELSGLERKFDFVAVACQDHGFVKGQRDRITRFNYLRELFKKSRRPWELYHAEKTGFLTRFDSILEQIEGRNLKGFVVDSKISAVASLIDYAEERGIREFVCIDCGNGHTLITTVKDGLVCGFLEHHTRLLTSEKLKNFMVKLTEGKITFEEVFNDGGHGALVIERISPQKVYLVGPNREKFKELGEFAHPLGDAMLFGCAGLLKTAAAFSQSLL
ncbi:DUF1786 family protein [Thermovibrio sp.]